MKYTRPSVDSKEENRQNSIDVEFIKIKNIHVDKGVIK